ncbi:MAG TPA: F0F1 ATP synthase subunit A [Thermoleophilaceae bacterium]|nr:F0F1 ATP synthase subunit A [Thermoleophilaceae bacterium]
MSKRLIKVVGIGVFLALFIGLFAIFGSEGQNHDYQPQNEFKLDPWISIHIGSLDLSINKAVLYIFLATALTVWAMVYIAKRMTDRPNNVQTAVESVYDLTYRNITRGNMDERMALKWFPFIGTLFLWILFSNLLGYIPLPTNSLEKFNIFGAEVPGFAIYAATANISIPLTLTLIVWVSYHIEGVRAKGFRRYLASWIPAGVPHAARIPLFFIEVISHFVRLISLTVRLFANILAGHMLILFMGGGLAVLLGLAALGVVTVPLAVAFFLFEVILIAGLQAYIFATLTAIYLGGAVAESH